MALDPRTPVIVGVGQQLQRIDDPLAALAPVPFIAEAIRAATADAGLGSLPDVDSIRVVSFLSWRYRDPARFIAEELGISATLLYNWRVSSQGPQAGSEGTRAVGEGDAADDLRALRRELTRLRQENDILKKAAVILGTRPQPNSEP